MKTDYISKCIDLGNGARTELSGWVKSKRIHKNAIFLDIIDSSGTIQTVTKRESVCQQDYHKIEKIPMEAAVKVAGVIKRDRKNRFELSVDRLELVGDVRVEKTPRPHENFDIFSSKHADYILRNRHLFLRNEKLSAALRFKSNFLMEAHRWFDERGFVFLDAPILTMLLLYDEDSAFKLDYANKAGKTEVFLSQCNMFQLEAAVHAFERVYNITPSFRAEHSRDNRHLREYWHLKAEIAWTDLNGLVKFASSMLYEITMRTLARRDRELQTLGITVDPAEFRPPYGRVTYDQAINVLKSEGVKTRWGKSLGTREGKILTKAYGNKPLFVEGIPCTAEAFPFSKNERDPRLTQTCDLIAPYGFGELLGTAEKITDETELLERMAEKGKATKEELTKYRWYIELRKYGCVPHGGIGMGVERTVRYLLKLPHVRDAVSFPRLCDRYPNP